MCSRTKKLGAASLVFIFVVVVPSIHGAVAENPWDFLQDFRHVEGTLRPIENRYVAALFYHAEKKLRAWVIFLATCEAQRCSLGQPVAYSVFDAKGLIIKSHENAGEKFLLERILTSVSLMVTGA
jgi:hypothetical protein